jgi:hypothetical protein
MEPFDDLLAKAARPDQLLDLQEVSLSVVN